MDYLSAIIYNSMILDFNALVNGSSLSLPAHGRAGARATSSLAAHFAKQNTKFGGGGKARAGKNSFPPTPFLFARPSANLFQNSAFGFSLKKVRISFRVRSQIVCSAFVASALRASAGRLYSICQDFLGSIATFCESKTRFAVAKQRANESLRANPFYFTEGGKQSDNF
ncbi:MAG: hypothetical protein FJ215_08285 [Ignavibacteria bacterium]|nr:hypothetical protein [Ignavibacteria bacterium]